MRCIIVDDEPLAREGIASLVSKTPGVELVGSFNSANAAARYLSNEAVDLLFLDIQMPGMNGIDFAKSVPPLTLVIFTTAYAEYALDSYEVEAVDYLIKPIKIERFQKAVNKASNYLDLLKSSSTSTNRIQQITDDYFFVKAERRIFKIQFNDILFIEGLKDYVVIQTVSQKVITAMNIKTIYEQLPQNTFARISKSYVINMSQVTSFDNNTAFIDKYEIPIGDAYRTQFFDEFVTRKLLSRNR
ncbi:LytR/AlgR family response regulator transcription factor [Dyadobacter endophyticus]